MVLRSRRRRTGPGPTGTALALLALVLAVAYVYYETPLIQAGGAATRLPGPPRSAWSADLPEGWSAAEPGALLLSVGERHILAARLLPEAVEAVWYDRFGYAAAQSAPMPVAGTGGSVLAASGLLVAAGPAEGSGPPGEPGAPAVRVVSPASLPDGLGWSPAVPTAGIEPVAVHEGMLAVAAFGAPAGPDLVPDLLAVLDLTQPQPVPLWSQAYEERRLLQAAGGPPGLAVTVVDPAQGHFQVELWSWQGDRLWSSDPSADPLRLLAVGTGNGSDPDGAGPQVYVASGSTFTALGPGGGGRALEDPQPPRQCWPVGSGAACLRPSDPGGDGRDELLFLTAGGRVSRHPVESGTTVWPWPGRGALLASVGSADSDDPGDRGGSSGSLTAFDAAGARWTLDLPLVPRVLAAGDDGVAISDGRRLAWLQWPTGGQR